MAAGKPSRCTRSGGASRMVPSGDWLLISIGDVKGSEALEQTEIKICKFCELKWEKQVANRVLHEYSLEAF